VEGFGGLGRVRQTGEQVGGPGLGVDPGTVADADEGVEGGGLNDPLRNTLEAAPAHGYDGVVPGRMEMKLFLLAS
jgi:hypothetical protein